MKWAAAALAFLVVPSQAWSQERDLASAAEKEKERRKRATSPATTYTDNDLPKDKGGKDASKPDTPAVSPSPAPAGETRSPARDEAYWRNRATGLRNGVAAAEQRVKKAQDDYGGARKGSVQPLPIDAISQVPPLAQVNPEADRLQKELEETKAALAQAQKALADFEEEARKAGVPPGWLR